MKAKFYLFLLLFNCFVSLDAQELNTPKNFKEIISSSIIKYGFQQADNYKHKQPILANPPFEATVYTIDGQRKIQKLLKKGNKSFNKKKWDKALKYYQAILDIDKQNIWILHKIASVYKEQNQLSLAIKTYSKILIINRLDYTSYWQSALIYRQEGIHRQAYRNITKAHLLNRNHPEILHDLKMIYLDSNLEYQDNWRFDFGYSFREVGKDSVLIKSRNEVLKAYATCKAVWKFSETYRNSKYVDYLGKLEYVEAKECLLNWLIAHEFNKNKEVDTPIDIQLFKEALAQRKENSFIIYEIWAVQNPLIFHTLEEDEIENVMQYLIDIRCKVIEK